MIPDADDTPPLTPRLSIVLPCYNESKNLPLIFERLTPLLQERPDVEVLLVDNGSTDDSARVFAEQQVRAALPAIRVCRVPVNRGYGFGIMSGIREARGEFLAWTHADMQTDPNDVLLGFERLLAAPAPLRTFVKGRRKNRPLLDNSFTFGMALLSSAALGKWLFDINAQPKIFPRGFLALLATPPDDFSLDLYALYQAQKNGYQLIEQDVFFARRQFGEAKGGGTMRGKVKLVKRTLGYIFQLRDEIRRGVR